MESLLVNTTRLNIFDNKLCYNQLNSHKNFQHSNSIGGGFRGAHNLKK